MATLRDKIRGMMVGVGVGDALGMPVENFVRRKVREHYPDGICGFVAPVHHHHWNDRPAGFTTDDTQLTVAVMKGIIKAGSLDMDAQAEQHVFAATGSTRGWGKSTIEAVERLAHGIHWSNSGRVRLPGRGTGNGVVMKLAPVAAFFAVNNHAMDLESLSEFSSMTHESRMSIVATCVHTAILIRCLHSDPAKYSVADVFMPIAGMYEATKRLLLPPEVGDDIFVPLLALQFVHYEEWDDSKMNCKEIGRAHV